MANFRPSDIAAGGQGAAPLCLRQIPFSIATKRFWTAWRSTLSGIANVTRHSGRLHSRGRVFAFDTGPGNMIVDALVQGMTRQARVRSRLQIAAWAAAHCPELLCARMMREPYLRKRPPKTAGRERFGQPYVEKLITWGATFRRVALY